MLSVTNLTGFGGAVVVPEITGAWIDADSTATNGSIITFSAMDFGAVPAGGEKRYMVGALTHNTTDSVNASGLPTVTIGGVTATRALWVRHLADPSRPIADIVYAEIATGTSGDVVITEPNDPARNYENASCDLYRLIVKGGSLAVHDTGEDTASVLSASVNTVKNGFVIANIATLHSTSGSNTASAWTELTEDTDAVVEAAVSALRSAASKSYTAAGTPTITSTITSAAGGQALAIASFSVT